jgi:hypothetical protein
MIITLKLLLAPLLILVATLAGRRWGPAFSGWLIGFPFISAPISMILFLQQGIDFTTGAAIGTLGGQASVCLFSYAYLLLAKKLPWYFTAPLAILVFLGCAFAWNLLNLGLWSTLGILLSIIFTLLLLTSAENIQKTPKAPAWWDLPARMITAAAFVALMTAIAASIGPQLSGLFSAFPVFGTTLAVFTHSQQGGRAAGQMLRGSLLGSFGITSFYVVVVLLLPVMKTLWVYAIAILAALLANEISLIFTRPRKMQVQVNNE